MKKNALLLYIAVVGILLPGGASFGQTEESLVTQEQSVEPNQKLESVSIVGNEFQFPERPSGIPVEEWEQIIQRFGAMSPENQVLFQEKRYEVFKSLVSSVTVADLVSKISKQEPVPSEWWERNKIYSEEGKFNYIQIHKRTKPLYEVLINQINAHLWRQIPLFESKPNSVTMITFAFSRGWVFGSSGQYKINGFGMLVEPIPELGKTRRTFFKINETKAPNSLGLALEFNLALRILKGKKSSEATPLEAIKGTTMSLPGPFVYYSSPHMSASGISIAPNGVNLFFVGLTKLASYLGYPAIATGFGAAATMLQVMGKAYTAQSAGDPTIIYTRESELSEFYQRVNEALGRAKQAIRTHLNRSSKSCVITLGL